MSELRISDKVKIIEHNNNEYMGKIGILMRVQAIQPAIETQVIKERVCKIKLDDTGEVVECLLSQVAKA